MDQQRESNDQDDQSKDSKSKVNKHTVILYGVTKA